LRGARLDRKLTAMARLFITVTCLDSWIEQGQATLAGDQLTTAGTTYHLEPAAHFAALAGSDTDIHHLLGTVKSKEQLAELGAEHLEGTVILGDIAYQVVEGFLGEPV
jgi:hypothetical protein